MKSLFFVALLSFFPLTAHAITWNFDNDGEAQGWQARETYSAHQAILPGAVRDGVWRITPPPFGTTPTPTTMLISPLIGHDSALFDRVAIRFRVVHTRPIVGSFILRWTNPVNRLYPGNDLLGYCGDTDEGKKPCHPRFWLVREETYTTDWQEVVISDLRTRMASWIGGDEYGILWEGELIDIRLMMTLAEITDDHPAIEGPEEVPEAIEIDRIVLTGVEEQLEGELPPPPVNPLGSRGILFAPAQFVPLDQGGFWGTKGSPFGDLDGDGDLDLVLSWWEPPATGLSSGINTGQGVFRSRPLVANAPTADDEFYPIPALVGVGDLNGDKQPDMVYKIKSEETDALMSDPTQPGSYTPQVIASRMAPLALKDFDGDGDLDLWATPWASGSQMQVLLNNGQGSFAEARPFGVKDCYFHAAEDLDADGKMDAIWLPLATSVSKVIKISRDVSQWRAEQTYDLEIESLADISEFRGAFVRHVGDLDGDGDVDAILVAAWPNKISENSFDGYIPARGLQVALNDGTDHLYTVLWYDERVQINSDYSIQAWDVNGDGILDPVVVNRNPRFPGVMVHLGQKGGLPVLEGYYELAGNGEDVWAGDVDNDRDLDLVVIDPAYQGGGIHLLINQSSQITAVAEVGEVLPVQSRLGSAYPNPFNPGVVIPFTLGPAVAQVPLTIYNILGQEVRKLALGVLPAGAHQVAWDGRDGQGKALSSGVYLYRLQAGAWSAAGKLVKSE